MGPQADQVGRDPSSFASWGPGDEDHARRARLHRLAHPAAGCACSSGSAGTPFRASSGACRRVERARRWPPSKDGLGDRPPGRTGPIIVRFTWFLARWKGLSSVCALPRDATATPTRPWGGLSVDVPPSQKLLIKNGDPHHDLPSHFHRHGPWTVRRQGRSAVPSPVSLSLGSASVEAPFGSAGHWADWGEAGEKKRGD